MFSEFTSRLHTNYVPSDREIPQIKKLLIKPQMEILALEKEIQRVQGLLNDLLLKHDALQGTLKAHEALISIPRRLPLDILQEIFLHCLPTDRNAVMDCKDAPLLLGRVRSNWRTTVYATPQLWSSIHICMFNDSIDVIDIIDVPLDLGIDYGTYGTLAKRIALPRYQAVRDWLNRTGSCPLSISFYGVPGRPRRDDIGHNMSPDHIMKILSPFSRQWRDMHFSMPAENCREALECLSIDDAPILRSLSMTATNYTTSWMLLDMSNVPIIAPDIQSLSFFPIPNMAMFKYLAETRWSQLTRLSLNCDIPEMSTFLKLSTTLSVLRHCPQITHFWFVLRQVSGLNEHRTLEGPSVTLTHLRSMIISTVANVQKFLDCLILPSLSSLAINLIRAPRLNNDLSSFINPFISRIGEQITSLTISCSTESSQEDLHRCMSHMPLVKRVHIVRHDWFTVPVYQFFGRHTEDANYLLCDETLEMLTPSKVAPITPIWPDLETLECDVDAMVTMERILDFLEARNGKADEGIAQIKRVKLNLNILVTQMEGDDARVCESRLSKLRKDGVEVDISWAKFHKIHSLSTWCGIETTIHQEW
ncbi:hypothetical protein BDQ12DRAFT_353869 [Crucibulum laeve]|uniref:F-box domain-containing protein n=1 Tax=Crucibulum laeve TaxID=68775 RepID=A0A5C3MB66_9AGAR|nr:hypothetical protein BDQ12DRAFT_353869 [Crucibulum laeve]